MEINIIFNHKLKKSLIDSTILNTIIKLDNKITEIQWIFLILQKYIINYLIKNRIYNKWTKKDIRNVRHSENASCVSKISSLFIIDRIVNAVNNNPEKGLINTFGG